jgi:hypothetical protein
MKNVAIRPDDRKVLAELSESEGRSMTEILHRALSSYKRRKPASSYSRTKYTRNSQEGYEPSNPTEGSH